MAHHYSSPYHQPYHSGRGGGSDRYHDEDDERRYHRSSRRGDDRHDPYETRGRFQSGSNRNYDQAPSIHVCKSRDYDNYVSDEHNNALENDCSERSFQRGMDPIERDWGDSRSRDNYGGRGGNSSLIRSRHSCDSLNSGITHSQHSNATYKPRPTYDDDDQDYHRVSPCNSSRCGDTRSTAASTCYSASQRGHRGDQGEQARSSRPAPRRASLVTQDHDRRFCSNASASGSSVCSRSAPLRRTPIPREPSLYRPDSSQHSSNSGRRTFAYHRRVTPPTNSQRGSYNTYKHNHPHPPHMVPPEHIDIVLSQERERQRQYNRRSSCSGNSSGSGSAANSNNNNNNGGTVMVDIAPGVQAPLRGTQETYKAVSKDFYANVSCFGCSLELCCIADVSYVVCPECKVISPLEGSDFEGKEIQRNGLGLGFTYESLFQMQVEIMKDRKTRD